jgi:hypothetical protein
MVKNWHKRSTHNFRFTAKFPKIITHDKRLKDVDTELGRFFEAMRPGSKANNFSTIDRLWSLYISYRRKDRSYGSCYERTLYGLYPMESLQAASELEP